MTIYIKNINKLFKNKNQFVHCFILNSCYYNISL